MIPIDSEPKPFFLYWTFENTDRTKKDVANLPAKLACTRRVDDLPPDCLALLPELAANVHVEYKHHECNVDKEYSIPDTTKLMNHATMDRLTTMYEKEFVKPTKTKRKRG